MHASVHRLHSSVRNSSYISHAIFTKLSQNDCHQVLQHILSGFCDSIVLEGVIALCLDLHMKASVRNSSISQVIFTKLSQNDCHQVLQHIFSGFWDLIIFEGVIALCFNLHIKASVCNSSYSSHAIFTKLSQND